MVQLPQNLAQPPAMVSPASYAVPSEICLNANQNACSTAGDATRTGRATPELGLGAADGRNIASPPEAPRLDITESGSTHAHEADGSAEQALVFDNVPDDTTGVAPPVIESPGAEGEASLGHDWVVAALCFGLPATDPKAALLVCHSGNDLRFRDAW